MNFEKLKSYLLKEEDDASLERDGYIGYLIPDNMVILVLSQRDDQTWLRAERVYHINCEDGEFVVIQLEGLSEDPFSCPLNGVIPVRFFIEQNVDHQP